MPTAYTVSGSGSFSDSAIITLSGSQVGVNYQLYGTSAVGSPKPGTGIGSLSFTTVTSGTYFVVATNPTTGCTDTMNSSAVVTVVPSSVQLITSAGGIIISPNPAHQMLSIKAPIINHVQIYDMVGRCIVDKAYNAENAIIDIGNFNPGLYLVRINNQFMQKIIKE